MSAEGRSEAEAARAALLRASVAAPGEAGLGAVADRVGGAVADAEPAGARSAWAERFAGALRDGRFWPSVPILANAGRGTGGQLAACFVLEPGDSLDSIYETLRRAARIQQGSGGVGIDLSRLRPRGAPIRRSGGVSPGPVAFAELIAHSARINALAGRREGAHLVILADSHPDVLAFVEAARETDALRGAGLAVAVSDALLEAARCGGDHALRDPRGEPAGRIPAVALLRAIAEVIRETGNPTLLFLDAIAARNPTPQLGAPRATNPCGEQPLLPGESCVLGSLALPAFADAGGRIDFAALGAAAREAVRFLDDVVEVTVVPRRRVRRGEPAHTKDRARRDGLRGPAAPARRGLREPRVGGDRRAGDGVRRARSARRKRGARRGAGRLPRLPRLGAGPPQRQPARDRAHRNAPPSRGVQRRARALARPRRARGERGAASTAGSTAGSSIGSSAARASPLRRWKRSRPGCRARPSSLSARATGRCCAGRTRCRRKRSSPLQARFQAHVDGAVAKTVHLPPDVSAERVVLLIQRARTLGCKGVAFWRGAGLAPARCVRCAL